MLVAGHNHIRPAAGFDTIFGARVLLPGALSVRERVGRLGPFRRLRLRHVDFGSAKLSEVSFPGSQVSASTVRNAQLKKVDFRRAHSIGIADGVESLRGALVTPGQLLDLAPTLAAAVGLVVQE